MVNEADLVSKLLRDAPGAIRGLAKLQVAGKDTALDRADWRLAIEQRAEHLYGLANLSAAQKFVKCIESDSLGQEMYGALKAAPNTPLPPPEPPLSKGAHRTLKAVADGPANARLHGLALKRQEEFPAESYAQSYAKTSDNNPELTAATIQEDSRRVYAASLGEG